MKQTTHSYHCLSGSTLKIIAMIAMFIDHLAASIILHGIIYPSAHQQIDTFLFSRGQWITIYEIMRTIGRIAFPIFCFLLVEGFIYTSNRKNYALRLLLFAFISEIPFDLAIYQAGISWNSQNVFFTLFLGFLTIWAMQLVQNKNYALICQAILILLGCAVAYGLQTDYDYRGILLIVILYFFRHNRTLQTIGGCLSLLWEAPACFAFIPLNMYNGKRGLSLKYFFYAFYPAHLLILGIILQLMLR